MSERSDRSNSSRFVRLLDPETLAHAESVSGKKLAYFNSGRTQHMITVSQVDALSVPVPPRAEERTSAYWLADPIRTGCVRR